MIVTLTLNPSLDRAIEVDALERGAVIRAASVAARRSSMRGRTSLLVVTGDHGMVELRPQQRVDLADLPELPLVCACWLVRLGPGTSTRSTGRRRPAGRLAGHPRRRDVGRVAGGGDRGRLVRAARVRPGAPRIGDVVAAARDAIGVFDRRTRPGEAGMLGHHGSMTPAEQLVPLLLLRR